MILFIFKSIMLFKVDLTLYMIGNIYLLFALKYCSVELPLLELVKKLLCENNITILIDIILICTMILFLLFIVKVLRVLELWFHISFIESLSGSLKCRLGTPSDCQNGDNSHKNGDSKHNYEPYTFRMTFITRILISFYTRWATTLFQYMTIIKNASFIQLGLIILVYTAYFGILLQYHFLCLNNCNKTQANKNFLKLSKIWPEIAFVAFVYIKRNSFTLWCKFQ